MDRREFEEVEVMIKAMDARMKNPEMPDKDLAIMIVDDDPGTVRLLSQMLKDVARIHFTTHGGEALGMARTIKPKLMLLDVEMPDANGIDVCRQMTRRPRSRREEPGRLQIACCGHLSQTHEAAAATCAAIAGAKPLPGNRVP